MVCGRWPEEQTGWKKWACTYTHTLSLSQPRIPKLPNVWTSPAVPDHKSAGISDGRRDSTRPLLGLTGRLYKLQPAARAPMDWHHHRQQSSKLHRFSLLSAFFFQSLILKFYAGDLTHGHFRKNKTFRHFQNETKYPGLSEAGGGVGYAFLSNIITFDCWFLISVWLKARDNDILRNIIIFL